MSKIKSSNDAILALDLGTSSVKAVLARRGKENIEILGSGKAEQFSGSMHAGAITDIPTVTSVCEQAIGAAEKIAGVRAKKTVVGISGEFVKGKTSTIHYRRNPEKPISEAEISLLLKKVQDKAKEAARVEIAVETMNPEADVRLINSSIVSVKIDGNEVNNPIGFRGSDLILKFYTAFAPLTQISAIEKVCAELSLDLISIAVEPFAICRAFLEEKTDFSGILIDVGSGTTDIAIVKKGGIEGTRTLAMGLDSLSKDFSVWVDGLEISLDELSNDSSLPTNIILSGGGSKNSSLSEALALSDWYKNLNFVRRPLINLLEPKNIPGFSYDTESFELNEYYVTSLGLLKVASDILTAEPTKLSEKLSRLLQK